MTARLFSTRNNSCTHFKPSAEIAQEEKPVAKGIRGFSVVYGFGNDYKVNPADFVKHFNDSTLSAARKLRLMTSLEKARLTRLLPLLNNSRRKPTLSAKQNKIKPECINHSGYFRYICYKKARPSYKQTETK